METSAATTPSEKSVFDFLREHEIPYECFEHPAVFTCEEAEHHTSHLAGTPTKNLFLRDKAGKVHLLVSVPHDVQVQIKELETKVGVSKLSFASPDRLKRYLGVEPGSVTILGLLRDTGREVRFVLHEKLAAADALQCHPLTNTQTLVIPQAGIRKFLERTGHSIEILR